MGGKPAPGARLQAPGRLGAWSLEPGAGIPAWLAIVSGRDRRLRASLARAVLLPLSWLYGAVIGAYRGLYRSGLLRTTDLPCRVIGVGNLTVGGTGKSTTVRWLVRRLSQSGQRAAVLSYGYRPRRARGSHLPSEATIVVSDGQRVRVPVATSGDEPRMLADALPGVPVLIGPRRVASGTRAVEEFGVDVCVLDDAFQYWRLRKDLEIVLIDAALPLGYGHLLPRGLLREPPRALGRADVVLLMNGHRLPPERRERLLTQLARLAPRALRLEGHHWPTGLRDLFTGEFRPLPWIHDRNVVALSSLGNPEAFEQTVRELGARGVVPRRFPDHHCYTTDEAIACCELHGGRSDEGVPVEAVVTTAKDAPKLREALGMGEAGREGEITPSQIPVLVLDIDLELAGDGAARLDRLLGHPIERD